MVKEIADIVGFQYKHIEGRTFDYAMKIAKAQIDMERPVVLGCLIILNSIRKNTFQSIMFFGRVPKMPNRILGIEEADDIHYSCGREQLASVLSELGKGHQMVAWCEASKLFIESGSILEQINEKMIEYLLEERTDLNEVPEMIIHVAQVEEKAYRKILSEKRNTM